MIRVERITPSHNLQQVLTELLSEEWEKEGHTESLESLQSFVADNGNYLLLAYLNDKPAGTLTAFLHNKTDERGQDMYVDEVDTKEIYRRQGVAKAMMETMLQLARDADCSELWVATEGNNIPANKLYESLSIKPKPERDVVVFAYPLK